MPGKANENYYSLYTKQIIDLLLAFLGLLLLSPFFLLISILIKIDSKGPIIFKQKRVGKKGKIFIIYKFRTMVKEAEKLKDKYRHLNEVDGPVFKIKNDPRFTRVGKFLSHTGLDELPQLINILKEEMSFVGPRPLPVDEEAKITPKQGTLRQSVRPGLVSSWLTKGAHDLTFAQWIQSDCDDIKNSSLKYDLRILFTSIFLDYKLVIRELIGKNASRI